jgi:hypothetical protein
MRNIYQYAQAALLCSILCPSILYAQQHPAQLFAEAPAAKFHNKKRELNENTVVIVGGPTNGTYIKMAEDLQYTLDRRDTNEMRVLPVVGVAGVNNILDVLFLRNVDMAMTETDYFDYLRGSDPVLYSDIDRKIQYITNEVVPAGRAALGDYPNLIPPGQSVTTVASGVVLAAYAWPENTER